MTNPGLLDVAEGKEYDVIVVGAGAPEWPPRCSPRSQAQGGC